MKTFILADNNVLLQLCSPLTPVLLQELKPILLFWCNNYTFEKKAPFIRIWWKRLPKTQLCNNALQSGDFWKRRLLIFVWTDQNGGFRIRWCQISYILLALCMFRKRWYAFSFGRTKTIRIRSGVSVWSMQYMSLSGFVLTWPEFLFLFNWVSLLTSWHVGNTCSECRELRTTR